MKIVVKSGIINYVPVYYFVFRKERFRMARPKKNGTYLNVCIESPIYERLVAFCDDAGQSKTVAVERALTAYLDDYDEKQKMLRELEHISEK